MLRGSLILLIAVLLLAGCAGSNTPTSRLPVQLSDRHIHNRSHSLSAGTGANAEPHNLSFDARANAEHHAHPLSLSACAKADTRINCVADR